MKVFSLPSFEQAYYSFYYLKSNSPDYITQEIVSYKNDNKSRISTFAALAEKHFTQLNLKADWVIRVLGSKEKVAQKGARVIPIAEAIARATGATYNGRLIKKQRETQPFKRIFARAARRKELEGVYTFDANTDLSDKTIVIVDDITTSGTTMEAIGALVKSKFPTAKIYGYCIAHTKSYDFDGISENEHQDEVEYKQELKNYP